MTITIRMRDDLAKDGLLIPAGLSYDNYDDLQEVIQASKQWTLGIPLQFVNMKS